MFCGWFLLISFVPVGKASLKFLRRDITAGNSGYTTGNRVLWSGIEKWDLYGFYLRVGLKFFESSILAMVKFYLPREVYWFKNWVKYEFCYNCLHMLFFIFLSAIVFFFFFGEWEFHWKEYIIQSNKEICLQHIIMVNKNATCTTKLHNFLHMWVTPHVDPICGVHSHVSGCANNCVI